MYIAALPAAFPHWLLLVQQQMLYRRYLPLDAAQHMTDPHQMIVHHMREMIRRKAVRFHDHRISLVLRHIVRHPAEHHIVERHAVRLVCVHLEPNAERLVFGQFLGQLHRRQMATPIVVFGHLARLQRLFAQQVQPSLRAEAIVRGAVLDQLLDVRMVQFEAFALHVRTVCTAVAWTLVRPDARPLEIGAQLVGGTRDEATLVGVLDAQHECAVIGACKQVVVEGSAQAAQMQVACGRSALGQWDDNNIADEIVCLPVGLGANRTRTPTSDSLSVLLQVECEARSVCWSQYVRCPPATSQGRTAARPNTDGTKVRNVASISGFICDDSIGSGPNCSGHNSDTIRACLLLCILLYFADRREL